MKNNSTVLFIAVLLTASLSAQKTNAEHGKRAARLIIRNAIVIDGSGTPASGPKDIVIENGIIAAIVPIDPVALASGRAQRPTGDTEIDASGKYVLPGFINAHAHIQDERGGKPQPVQYEFNIWLASGITTVRDVASNTRISFDLKKKSAANSIVAPRILVYPVFPNAVTPDDARRAVHQLKDNGADGIKFFGIQRDIMIALGSAAKETGLRLAHHTGVEETNAWDDVAIGTTSIEHWYGIPDAALENGVQNFPASYNYSDEIDRFRYAGHLWREVNPERLSKVLQAMADAHVAWDPTFSIYEASRDLQRAQNKPWFAEYLHPALRDYFQPNAANHGSYFAHWTSTDEAFWKENYRIWMAAVREFEKRGGLVGVGDDAGFIYSMYGFGLIRELELHQEAGFPPLKVIQHATSNNAKILGIENHFGRVRTGYAADLLVIKGNPLEDFKILYASNGGIEWTIKDGIPYNDATLMAEVRKMVSDAKEHASTSP